MYYDYKIARNKSWEVLLKTHTTSLPVNLTRIAKYFNIQILNYTDAELPQNDDDGYCYNYNGNLIIYYNDSKPINRIRFTIAHELGHCILGHLKYGDKSLHRNNEYDVIDPMEQQANVFARDILMPATVLHSLNVQSAQEISDICKVSMQSAEIRWLRLQELNKRGMYNKHPLERQVHNQFNDYIEKIKWHKF